MTEPWVTENKGAGPWTFEKQPAKYGYRNNPKWVNPAGTGVETLSPVWPMAEGQMSAGASDKHEPCGYWPIGGGRCPALILYTTQQMDTSETQTLSVETPVVGTIYSWAVSSGGGSVNPTTGIWTYYKAPATNPNCLSNPTITLSVGGVICCTLEIAINAGNGVAFAITRCNHERTFDGTQEVCALVDVYYGNCDGTEGYQTQCGGGSQSGGAGSFCASIGHESCEAAALSSIGTACTWYSSAPLNIYSDKRSTQYKLLGCCPWQLM